MRLDCVVPAGGKACLPLGVPIPNHISVASYPAQGHLSYLRHELIVRLGQESIEPVYLPLHIAHSVCPTNSNSYPDEHSTPGDTPQSEASVKKSSDDHLISDTAHSRRAFPIQRCHYRYTLHDADDPAKDATHPEHNFLSVLPTDGFGKAQPKPLALTAAPKDQIPPPLNL